MWRNDHCIHRSLDVPACDGWLSFASSRLNPAASPSPTARNYQNLGVNGADSISIYDSVRHQLPVRKYRSEIGRTASRPFRNGLRD